jgi:hypothetical protein
MIAEIASARPRRYAAIATMLRDPAHALEPPSFRTIRVD